jgi:hypothetical protein
MKGMEPTECADYPANSTTFCKSPSRSECEVGFRSLSNPLRLHTQLKGVPRSALETLA